jgi:cytochrome P450
VPFFTRDDERVDSANRFAPQLWMHKDPGERLPLVPFSAGPAICPGRHLVAMVASLMITALINGRSVSLLGEKLSPQQLPGTLDHYGLRIRLTA